MGEGVAARLADWATGLRPTTADMALAGHALRDTVAVTLAARGHPLRSVVAGLSRPARWAAIGHVLDFDDLHLPSTTHISVVCVPATLATGGDARAYLAGAGVMARLGVALGWRHYTDGWHATCTAGAPAAAVAAGVALGLNAEEMATALALAVPAAGGVQRAFGTDAKALQVGFATEAGVRAARLAAAGATADPAALDQWLGLMTDGTVDTGGPAVPGGLATKLFPCCYALQRPIGAARALGLDPGEITDIVVRTPAAAVHPLIHHDPLTGLQGKFSLEYGIATALLDEYPGFAAFEDAAVRRPAARQIMSRVTAEESPGGEDLLTGETGIEIRLADGSVHATALAAPPGSPALPATEAEFAAKLADCDADLGDLSWADAHDLLEEEI
jgi:2-methylcitrate dehydratase PrpD